MQKKVTNSEPSIIQVFDNFSDHELDVKQVTYKNRKTSEKEMNFNGSGIEKNVCLFLLKSLNISNTSLI